MAFTQLLLGIFVKLITGFDDLLTHIPIVATLTKRKKGRLAFATGVFLAIGVVIIIALFFATLLKAIPYRHYIVAALLALIALAIHFDLFVHKPREKAKRKLTTISAERFFQLAGIGFLAAFATVIDDAVAYSSLFLGSPADIPYGVAGILLGTLLQLATLVYFSAKITKLPYKEEITSIGLLVLATLTALQVI